MIPRANRTVVQSLARTALVLTGLLTCAPAVAQMSEQDAGLSAENPDSRPSMVTIGESPLGHIYTTTGGMTLYAMDLRTAQSRAGVGAAFCIGPCAQTWTVLAAPAGAKQAGSWTVAQGAQGPQWAYKGDPVFTFNADKGAGSVAGNGHDEMWAVIPYVPPAPRLVAPAFVVPRFVDGEYMLVDAAGHALFSSALPDCKEICASWTPLVAGMASGGVGQWQVARDGERARWMYKGKPVYVSQEKPPAGIPDGAVALRP